MKLDICRFGGRGASSSDNKINLTKDDLDFLKKEDALIKAKFGANSEEYKKYKREHEEKYGKNYLKKQPSASNELSYYKKLLKFQQNRLKNTPKDADITRDAINNAIKYAKDKIKELSSKQKKKK